MRAVLWRRGASKLTLIILSILAVAGSAPAATFTVNSTGDGVDASPGDGACTTAGAVCTLRAAIMEANALAGTDTIGFNIAPAGAKTITPGSALPNITSQVTIDGTTQGGYGGTPVIELSGALAGAGVDGLSLVAGSSGSVLRGLVINRFSLSGMVLSGTNDNVIERSYIGTDVGGSVALGNAQHGILIANGASDNVIGSLTAGAGNVISGNLINGIDVLNSGTTGNRIVGNIIGLDASGTADLGNTFNGVAVAQGASGNFIGEAGNGRNILSGNDLYGVRIVDAGTSNNQVSSNFIGLDATGTLDRGNGSDGVRLEAGGAATGNVIGGATAGLGNVISGNGAKGVRVLNSMTATLIVGNLIGTNAAGTAAVGNSGDGVFLQATSGNTVGGTTAAARNVVSGNNDDGIEISGSSSTGNLIQGNYVGLDAPGTAALGNANDGVVIWQGTNNTIGGTAVGAGNVVSANESGLYIAQATATGNVVQGNLIGTNAAGTAAVGNITGIFLEAFTTTIGGTVAGARNVISGNTFAGLWLWAASGAVVEGNYFGTAPDGTSPIANRYGVYLSDGANNNTIGGSAAGAANRIAYGTQDGIALASTAGSGNLIRANEIHSNGGLGIDIDDDGVTANDAGDGDAGPNGRQNHPVLSAASTNGAGSANFAGSLSSTPSTVYRIELFASTAADPSGFGEGERYLGFTDVTTNAAGNAVIGMTLATALSPGELVTATATDPSNNTSELSAALAAVGSLVVTTTSDTVDGTTTSVANLIASPGADGRISLREAIQATNGSAGADTVPFGIPIADANHFYYQNDGMAGSLTNVQPTALSDDVIADFDPDYPPGLARSWYRMRPSASLPWNTEVLTLDATTQPGYLVGGPVVEIDGISAGASGRGFTVPTAALTIRGFVINRFDDEGITSSAASTLVQGCYVGTEVSGTILRPNGTGGGAAEVYFGGDASQLGGPTLADRNVIAARIWIDADNVVIQGNYIGTDVTGAVALGVNYSGITLQIAATPTVTNVTIGGTAPGAGNLISGNLEHGIVLSGPTVQNNVIEGNFIGTIASGASALPNGFDGIFLTDGTANNRIGGTAAGAGNRIAFNTGRGVALDPTAGSGNAILSNEIHANGGIGIDLGVDGVTANDAGDGDTGANALLNFPFVTSVQESAGTLTSYFKLDVPAGSYRIEFFENPSGGDGSGNGEGEVFVSAVNVAHPGGGSVNFNHAFSGSEGDVITATATFCTDGATCAAFGSTSELSNAFTAVTTEVTLASFTALGRDRAVDLHWRTASEMRNLGFHLYRGLSPSGPFERITDALIPGLGSSPTGADYHHRDSDLSNGVTYYYQLQDVETTGRTAIHGPVAATPMESPAISDDENDEREPPGTSYGVPELTSLRVLHRDGSGVLLELTTGGFVAIPLDDGTVRISVPGFDDSMEAGAPSLPVKRSWIEAVAGRGARITSVRAFDATTFRDLRPSGAPVHEIVALPGGTVRAGSRRARAPRRDGGVHPASAARVIETGFQGDTRRVLLELAPLRWDGAAMELSWARRLEVRLSFAGADESMRTTRGRRGRGGDRLRTVLARLSTSSVGLHRVRYEDVFRGRGGRLSTEPLRLSRLGEAVPYHVEPSGETFGPGSVLYFLSPPEAENPHTGITVYELGWGSHRRTMLVEEAAPSGPPLSTVVSHETFEENRYYQAGLLEASSPWLWDVLLSRTTKSFPFPLRSLAEGEARLEIELQGASDFEAAPDHHVRITLNGTLVAEASWDGKSPKRLAVSLAGGSLREGENVLSIENVGDTLAPYSMVFLDRYALTFPRRPVAERGRFEGSFRESGTVTVSGLGEGSLVVQTGPEPRWIRGALAGESGIAFRAESGGSYLALSPSAVLEPSVSSAVASSLRSERNRADYLLIGPRAFFAAAEPLLEHRRQQGLVSRAVAIEEIYDEFGFGEARPSALKEFLAYAYHHWERPAVRYVVLLGDATYDGKDVLGTGAVNRVPAWTVRTSYLWTASDPSYAAVHGEDALPDLALGRLPAASVEEARALVRKVIAYEASGQDLSAPVVMVADDPDQAGDFRRNLEEIFETLPGRDATRILLEELGAAEARRAIVESFDRGASLLSYVGHGGIAVWASENLFDNEAVALLSPQARQPIVMTMNCLNGYFHFPYFDSLGEALLAPEDRGAIAVFAPSGLSLDAPAHVYHRALVTELASGRHARLGDAVLEAQRTYAESGYFPELLAIYHLFGDPALALR